ncbi:MAG: cytochrome c biogenesis protein CcdA [Kiritimatiellia bacterium]
MRFAFAVLVFALAALARATDPFTVTARLERAGAAWQVVVGVDVPPQHVLYADQRFEVLLDGKAIPGRVAPEPVTQPDPAGQMETVFTGRVTAIYALTKDSLPVEVKVRCQGCSETACFPPRTRTYLLAPDATREISAAAEPGASDSGWLAQGKVKATAAGYLGRSDFLDFLARARGQASAAPRFWWQQFRDDPTVFLERHGIGWTLLLVLLGGFLLNLTPCVLPMIPVNLAIIGAGARAGSRLRGLALGVAYGAGIAVVYGALGAVVVLTGSVFGALQSSPVFNGVMAALFLALALAMFDVIPIDLTRFQRGRGAGNGFLTAGVAGGVSALLAGACVAPVVAAVLLLASSLYHGGSAVALLLPFMLGAGMALPWPLAGAGLAVLPRPGAWMLWVKYGFGVLIAVMGIYYGALAYGGMTTSAGMPVGARADGHELAAGDVAGWGRWVAEARRQGKPLLLDFYASWCKNCHAMDRTTFRDPAVRQALEQFFVVRVAAERPDQEPALGMCRAFGVSGLPTYVVVETRVSGLTVP